MIAAPSWRFALLAALLLGSSGSPALALDLEKIFQDPDAEKWKTAERPVASWQIERIEFDEAIVERVTARVGSPPTPLVQPGVAEAIGFYWRASSTKAEAARALLAQELATSGYRIFLATRNFGAAPDRLALIKGRDPLEAVLARQTSAPSGSPDNAAIVQALRSWAKAARLTVTGAGSDWLEVEFEGESAQVEKIVDEAMTLAPALLEGGLGGRARVVEHVRSTGKLLLWWE